MHAITTQLTEILPAFPPRDGKEHSRKAQEYAKLADKQQRDTFFAEHATRYFELSRLPYFDPVKMTIIDPTHNILLGKYFCVRVRSLFERF